jgi:hypothetical protein
MAAPRPHQERRRSSTPQDQRRGLRRVLLLVVPVFLLGGTVGVLGRSVLPAPAARPARVATGAVAPAGLDMCAPATGPGGTTVPMRMEEDGLQMEMYPTTCTPPTWAELHRVQGMLARAKAATDKYRDFRRAVRDGYARTALAFVRGQGYHYLNLAYLDRGFDLRHPPFLVYARVRGHLVLQGLMYYLPVQTTAQQLAAIFPPSLASWHRHLNVCLQGGTVRPVYTAAACTRQGGDFLATTGWMVHAWLWRAHSGLFTIDM